MKNYGLAICFLFMLSVPAHAQTDITSKFKPRPENTSKLDYTIWNEILDGIVVYTGPSIRIRAPKPKKGVNVGQGHRSPYRLEGNKIAFSKLNTAWETAIREYSQDLEYIANTHDVSKFPKTEQLAFWYNLHNSRLISLIADNYPVTVPDKIKTY